VAAALDPMDAVRTAPFFAVAAALVAVNMWFQTHGMENVVRKAEFAERVLGAGAVLWFYLSKASCRSIWLLSIAMAHRDRQLALVASAGGRPLPLRRCCGGIEEVWRPAVSVRLGFFLRGVGAVMGFTDVGSCGIRWWRIIISILRSSP